MSTAAGGGRAVSASGGRISLRLSEGTTLSVLKERVIRALFSGDVMVLAVGV